MSKRKIVLMILIIIFGGYVAWQLILPNEPIVNLYKWRYEVMSKPEYLQQLRDFCKYNLSDPIENLNYSQLVAWIHKYITYTPSQFNREEEMPIAILKPYVTDRIAFGRCGEFALCYNGLCLANGYKTRLVLDDSKASAKNKTAGDHVWVEVWDNGTWHPVEVTQSYEGLSGLIIDQPKYYRDVWNKEINNIVAITKDTSGKVITVDVTKDYQ